MQATAPSSNVSPIRYRDPMGAIDWLCAAFQFELRSTVKRADGSFAYAHLALGGELVTITVRDERSVGPAEPPEAAARNAQAQSLAVADIEAHFAHAVSAGAAIVRGLDGGTDAGRSYACRDLEGNVWSFSGAQAHAPRFAWPRLRVPNIEKVAAQRAGVAAAVALTLFALALPLWRLREIGPGQQAPEVAEHQALEHARFALAEERIARQLAEAVRGEALAELARERAAREEAQRNARRAEAELSAHVRQAAEAALAQEAADQSTWDTQIARAAESEEPAAAAIVPVSAAPSADPAPAAAQATAMPDDPVLAEGQAALARGDVEEARNLFRRLAEAGLAAAALALGSTYDPVNVERAGLAQAEADREQAKRWYRRAIELAQRAAERQRAP